MRSLRERPVSRSLPGPPNTEACGRAPPTSPGSFEMLGLVPAFISRPRSWPPDAGAIQIQRSPLLPWTAMSSSSSMLGLVPGIIFTPVSPPPPLPRL